MNWMIVVDFKPPEHVYGSCLLLMHCLMGVTVWAHITHFELGCDDETTTPAAKCGPHALARKLHFYFDLTLKEAFPMDQ